MNETKWLTGTDGDAMLEVVADRLSPRQWLLAAAAYARRLWDFLPPGVLQQAIDCAERATEPLTPEQRAEWERKIAAAVPEAVGAAELAQRDIVKLADPDAAGQDAPVLARPNQIAPAFPLFQAASRHAANAIEWLGEAVNEAAAAVRVLFAPPNEQMLENIRPLVERALASRTRANGAANNALRLKHEGDEHADRSAGVKNKRIAESEALEIVRKIEEGRPRTEDDEFEADLKREKRERKQLARVLREIVGNAFTPPRFEPAWRTNDVVALARGIFEERAFDRMVILADALLDADCDEEAVLRHCRGTEIGAKEPPQHIRGCWVIEMILGRYEPLPAPKPGKKPKPRPLDDMFDFRPLGDDDPRFA
ncbi:hypothetical protein [Frigoriglobus tundricola]|uniref:Uncharacterized protein n=1 Tax=Frigoriglobus tundricola TaxID=2774151 RepID=A0A6M5YLY8_9BACT|nr:hypothetical protein [Frigoriglobus tundricola]QJW94370.1 hypothetical protein FTUN_1890 [Frigoriglobus tundricola]